MKLSIVIPAYNESDRIIPTLEHTLSYLDDQPYSAEVLVVSDGSTDDTRQVVAAMSPTCARVTLKALEYHPNQGKGYAVRYGMTRAMGEMIMFMDADYSVPIQAVEDAMALLRAGADMAIASRSIKGSVVTQNQSYIRSLSGKIYTAVQNLYLGIHYKDTQCGFKVFSRKAACRLFGAQKLNSVIFDPEILYLAKRQRYRVAQFPVTWHHHEDSRIQYDSLKKFLFVFQELYKIRRIHG